MVKEKNLKRRKKKCLKIIVVAFVILLAVIGMLFLGYKLLGNKQLNEKAFIASTTNNVAAYDEKFKEVAKIVRGSTIVVKEKNIVNEKTNQTFDKITYNKKDFMVLIDNVVTDKKDIVKEKELYVRTPVTLYKNSDSSEILSLIKKGQKVDIIGYDRIDQEGYVNMYKVKYNDLTGFVYRKYLLENQEEALKYYDMDNSYKIHSARGDRYGGGDAGMLDYYPVTKPTFENNKMPDETRTLYMNAAVIKDVDSYISLAKNSNINAFVVDIKDNTSPGYASLVMQKMSPTNYKHALNSLEDYKQAIKKLKDNGFYVIGRITTFKDSYYVEDHKEVAIADANGQPFSHNGSYWPSAFNRSVWEFNVELAKEAVKEMGFNEIQFDYVRFPDRTYKLEQSGQMDMKNIYGESKAQALQAFLMYATDELHKLNVYVSADVFGECAYNYVAAYGQYWPAISNIVDVISAMPYPDHFNKYDFGLNQVVWTVPYDLLKVWGGDYAAKRQTEIPTPAKVRTWIQTYNTIHEPFVVYDESKISDQIKALYESGLDDGYMTWHSASSLAKYKEVSGAFKKEYR
ncbi:MAG: putative glycoside hydrolase [Bacilli bacterium]